MKMRMFGFGPVAALATLACFAATAHGQGVVLWNKLGSDTEVTNSEVGPDGVISPGSASIDYLPVQFANGVRVNAEWPSGTEVAFVLDRIPSLGSRGTISAWVRPDHDSNDGDIARWLTWRGPLNGVDTGLYWRGWDQGILFELCTVDYGCGPYPPPNFTSILVPNTQVQFSAGDILHVAIVWDQNGIEGTTDTLRAYVNGVLMGARSPHWSEGLKFEGLSMGNGDYSQRAAVDNLVIYDYAKTDFSDRFIENPGSSTFSSFNPRVEFKLGPKPNDDSYWVRGWIKLAASSDGINPLTEPVSIQVGNFSYSIPAKSFVQDGNAFTFVGPVGSSTLDVKFWPLSLPGTYWFKSCLKNGNLAETSLQPKVQLTIGDDQGQATLDVGYGKFGKGKRGAQWVFPEVKVSH